MEQETSWRRTPDGKRITVCVEQTKEVRTHLKFLQLVDRTLDTESTERDDLIDLRVTRRAGAPSGFQRDQNFRLNVLDAFDQSSCKAGFGDAFRPRSPISARRAVQPLLNWIAPPLAAIFTVSLAPNSPSRMRFASGFSMLA